MNIKEINRSEDIRLNRILLEKEIEHLQRKKTKA
jgi:hypothetical protein